MNLSTPATQVVFPVSNRLHRVVGPLSGFLAMLAFLVITDLLRRATGVTSLLDALADALLYYLPMGAFSLALDLFGAQAKTMLLAGLIVGLLLLGAWLGKRHERLVDATPSAQWILATTRAVAFFGICALFMIWYIGTRSTIAVASQEMLEILQNLGLAAIGFGVVLAISLAVLRAAARPAESPLAAGEGLDRRRFATWGATAIGALAGIGVIGRAVEKVANRPIVGVTSPGEISPAITPNDDFYVISKNFSDPTEDPGDNWTLTVDGAVSRELKLTPADLEALGSELFISTLNCISNPVGGPLIGTAEWRGVPLADVLNLAGIGPDAVDLVMSAVDDYTDSIPIVRAMQPEPHLVWEMNGERLPQRHGVPLRLIVPGIYGMKNVKWLTKMTVTTRDEFGFWAERGWSDVAIVKTMSRFDVPSDHNVFDAGRVQLGGVAFAGDRGVSKVEVSFDDGSTWQEATIRENPSPDGLSWVIWIFDWDAKPGTYELVVRATDGDGEVQTSEHAPELPDGSAGWHRVTVGVS